MLTRDTVRDKDFCSVCEQENLGNRKRKCQSADLAFLCTSSLVMPLKKQTFLLCTSSLLMPSELFKAVSVTRTAYTSRAKISRTTTGCNFGLVRGILVGLTVTLLHFGPTGHQSNLRIAAQAEREQSDIKQQASHALVRYQFVFRPNKLS